MNANNKIILSRKINNLLHDELVLAGNFSSLKEKITEDNLIQICRKAHEIDPLNGMDELFEIISIFARPSSWIIKKMLELGVSHVNYNRVLLHCFLNNDIDLTKYLVEDLGADINGINFNCFGYTPSSSNHFNNPKIVKLLLNNGLILSEKTKVFCLFPEIINLFIESNIDINEILKFNCLSTTREILTLQIDKIQKSNNVIKQDYLHYILYTNYRNHDLSLKEIKILIEAGADPRLDNDSALILACSHGNIETVKFFLNECGLDINSHNSDALTYAVFSRNFDLIDFLFESGIKINDAVISSFSGLYYVKTLSYLLNAGIDAEYIGKIFWSEMNSIEIDALERRECIKYIKELINYGVDFNKIITE